MLSRSQLQTDLQNKLNLLMEMKSPKTVGGLRQSTAEEVNGNQVRQNRLVGFFLIHLERLNDLI